MNQILIHESEFWKTLFWFIRRLDNWCRPTLKRYNRGIWKGGGIAFYPSVCQRRVGPGSAGPRNQIRCSSFGTVANEARSNAVGTAHQRAQADPGGIRLMRATTQHIRYPGILIKNVKKDDLKPFPRNQS